MSPTNTTKKNKMFKMRYLLVFWSSVVAPSTIFESVLEAARCDEGGRGGGYCVVAVEKVIGLSLSTMYRQWQRAGPLTDRNGPLKWTKWGPKSRPAAK